MHETHEVHSKVHGNVTYKGIDSKATQMTYDWK